MLLLQRIVAISLNPSLRTKERRNMPQFDVPRNLFLVKEEYSPNAINLLAYFLLRKEQHFPGCAIFLTRSLVRSTRLTALVCDSI